MLRTLLMITSLLVINLTNSFAEEDLSFLKENMPYMEVRQLLLQNGWKPNLNGESEEKSVEMCLSRQYDSFCIEEAPDSEFCIQEKNYVKNYQKLSLNQMMGL